jgi:hypothetical protein
MAARLVMVRSTMERNCPTSVVSGLTATATTIWSPDTTACVGPVKSFV